MASACSAICEDVIMLPGDRQLDHTLKRMEYGRALKGALLMERKPQERVPYAQPLLDALNLFEELGIGYALVGGIAAMYYGRARFTEDANFIAVTGHMDLFASHPAEMKNITSIQRARISFITAAGFRSIFGRMSTPITW